MTILAPTTDNTPQRRRIGPSEYYKKMIEHCEGKDPSSPMLKKEKKVDEKESFKKIMLERQRSKEMDPETFRKEFDDQTKLLCAMIKNQPPGEEMDTFKIIEVVQNKRNAELMFAMRQELSDNTQIQKRVLSTQSTKFLNKDVKISTDNFVFNGDAVQMAYTIDEPMKNAYLDIFSDEETPQHIFRVEIDPNQKEGEFIWNGRDQYGQRVLPGNYNFRVGGESFEKINHETGRPLPVRAQTFIHTTIDGMWIDSKTKEPQFTAGRMIFDVKDVQLIRKSRDAHTRYPSSNQHENDTQTDETIHFNPSSVHERYASQQAQTESPSTINQEV